MARKKVSVLLTLCILVVLAISACGGDEESSTPSTPPSTPASTSPEKTTAAKAAADAKAKGKDESKAQAKREQEDHKEESADAPSDSSMGSEERGAKPSVHMSDEERCARKPSTCGPDENAAPDYSNPDVRRAEERAKEPSELPECHSTDCEELRRGEG